MTYLPPTSGKKAVGYIRVSTVAQVRDGESLERQQEKIENYCNYKGYQLEIISDNGVSGYKSTRPGYNQLKEICRKKQADLIVVYDLSRLSRSTKETLIFLEDYMAKYGLEFVSLGNDIDTTTPHGKAFLTITATFNQLFRDEISWKTKLALDHKRENGEKCGGTIPYGFDVVDGKLVNNQKEQEVIRVISKLRNNGHSLRAICRQLRIRQYPTKNGSLKWHPKVVNGLLQRRNHAKESTQV